MAKKDKTYKNNDNGNGNENDDSNDKDEGDDDIIDITKDEPPDSDKQQED